MTRAASNDSAPLDLRGALKLSLAIPADGRLAQLQAKSLARIIANLINENEPLLKAYGDGNVVSVDERGGTGGFVVTVTPAVAARSLDEGLDPR